MSLTKRKSDAAVSDHRTLVRNQIPFFILLLDQITAHLYRWCRSTASISGQHMSPSRTTILRFLEDNPGAPLGAVADHLGVKKPTMSGMVSRLEVDGYIDKVKDKENLKRLKIYNTKKASNLLEIYHRNLMQSILGWLGGMSENDLDQLVSTLETVAQNLGVDELSIHRGNKKRVDIYSAKLESLLLGIRNAYDSNVHNIFREVSDDMTSSRLQGRIITYTYANPGASVAEVSKYLGVRTSTTGQTIKLLEREGLVIRMAANKGNKISLFCTEKAKELVKALRKQSISIFSLALSNNLSPANYAIIQKAIDCIYASPSIDQESAKAVTGFIQADS